jgi:MFS family permease
MNKEKIEKMERVLSESAKYRWGILFLVSFAMATNYYFYDVLSPIQEEIIKLLGSATLYGGIISAYSIPNTFFLMAVLGGIICDKLGIRLTGVLFFLSMVIGAFLTYYGTTDYFNKGGIAYDLFNSFLTGYPPAFKMMALGFFFFGLGAETSCVVIAKIVVKWFKGKELATALGINVGIARVASSATFSVGAWLAEPTWNMPVVFGAIIMLSGFIAFIIYIFFDIALDKSIGQKVAVDRDEEPFRFKDVGKLLATPSYLYIALLCVTFYSAVFPFNKFAVDLMQNKFSMTKQLAGLIVSVLPLAQAMITPLFGWVCDYKGKSASLMIIGSLLLISGHTILSLTSLPPWVALVLLGIAFSLVPAAMWPALAKIVDIKRLGTAYGLTFSIQNLGLFFTPMLIGYVLDVSNPGVSAAKQAGKEAIYNYTNPILMLAFYGLLGLIFAILLKREDKTSGFGLELPNKVKS